MDTDIVEQTEIETLPYPPRDCLNVGCGKVTTEFSPDLGWVNLDRLPLPNVDVICDVERNGLPFADNSFKDILLKHVYEHFDNPIPVMEEIYRVAQPGARVIIIVPYFKHESAYADPTHKQFISEGSFAYLDEQYAENNRFTVASPFMTKFRFKIKAAILVPDKKFASLSPEYRHVIPNFVEQIILTLAAIK